MIDDFELKQEEVPALEGMIETIWLCFKYNIHRAYVRNVINQYVNIVDEYSRIGVDMTNYYLKYQEMKERLKNYGGN